MKFRNIIILTIFNLISLSTGYGNSDLDAILSDPTISDGKCTYPEAVPALSMMNFMAEAVLKNPYYETLISKQFQRMMYWFVTGSDAQNQVDLDKLKPTVNIAGLNSIYNSFSFIRVNFFRQAKIFYELRCMPSGHWNMFRNMFNLTCSIKDGSPPPMRIQIVDNPVLTVIWHDGSDAFLIWSCSNGVQQFHIISTDKTPLTERQMSEVVPILENLGFNQSNFVVPDYLNDF